MVPEALHEGHKFRGRSFTILHELGSHGLNNPPGLDFFHAAANIITTTTQLAPVDDIQKTVGPLQFAFNHGTGDIKSPLG